MRPPLPFVRLLMSIALLLLACTAARADGLIIIPNPPRPVPGHFAFAPLEVTFHHVEVTIKHQVAVTEVDQEFYNPSGARVEGEYLFPLPEGASIDNFAMDVNGEMTPAELLPADKARSLYEEIVRRQRDPALLEYVGRGALRARIFPIEPNAKKRVKLKYTQALSADSGLVEYTYPLNTEKFSARPLREVTIRVEIEADKPIKSIYSPSHDIEIHRHGKTGAVAAFEQRNVRPDTDFKLIHTHSADDVGVSVLTYRPEGEDGYFFVMASPGTLDTDAKPQPKDICFVLDTSGSMAGDKMEQAKKALSFCLSNLNEDDRFEIIRFSTEAEALFGHLEKADREHVKTATDFLDGLRAVGGTAIDDALARALSAGADRADDGDRPYVVIFLTDGQPTVGQRDEDAIVHRVDKRRARDLRIFSFGIGSDVNTHLLDRIANETRAFSQYVLPKEDIEVKVSNFYTRIQSPVLTDVKLTIGNREDRADNISVSRIYPPEMPDLFAGQTLLLFGRYRGHGRAQVIVSGMAGGKQVSFSTPGHFPDRDDSHGFIARLWATRRVGWLLDEIRLHGESKELKDEVVSLARQHGIVTPYTAYLILEDERSRNVPLSLRSFGELESDAAATTEIEHLYDSARADSPRLEKAGERAVENAQATGALKSAANQQAPQQQAQAMVKQAPTVAGQAIAPDAAEGYYVRQNFAQQVRAINGKTFYQNGNTWTDAAAQSQATTQPGQKRQQIKFNSEDYFALVRAHPDAAQWLSVGTEIDVVIGDTLYEIR